MIGQPANTLGEFPISVSISSTLQQTCVANSGAVAGVSCFAICPTQGLVPLDTAVRPFQLNQTTPPSGPLNTVSQVFFNKDSTMLLATVKGDPTKNNTGFLSMFPVTNGSVSRNEIRTSPTGTAVLFGTALLPDADQIFVTDASFGSATLSLPSNSSNLNLATVSSSTKIADQKATCWATFSSLTSTTFVTDVAVNHLVEVDPSSGQLITEFQSQNGNGGMIDLESDQEGGLIFALSPGGGEVGAQGTNVVVFDVSGGKGSVTEMQNFAVQMGVAGGSAQGMAIY
ncbi:uncharacterized protein LY89DRAFT_691807 [Mollisia scopiformis]|uniref:Uncharacterized protein n=1 Tax=Mollisia scopiformis TaxID=149040 RepID=A0A132B627_MOLSC|nr:uncharacterized protein LY89DRAFT_691807 [Mollisia scopiformis]KUJ07344.1 hypothetical protein LY89DRAFT_691807 [Mollisia scopiformis]